MHWIDDIRRDIASIHSSLKELKKFGAPELILMTSVMTYWYPGVHETIREVRQIHPETPIILGGNYATLCRNHAQQFSGADRIITGGDFKTIFNGLKFHLGDKLDIDQIPLDFSGYPVPDYSFYSTLHSAAILTSRGCPYACDYCASRHLWQGYKHRTINSVTDEIMFLQESMQSVNIAFYDDALLFNAESHLLPILKSIQARGFKGKLHLPNGISPGNLTLEIAEFMKATGFYTLRLSFESAIKKFQHRFSNKVSNEAFKQSVQIFYQAGFVPSQIETYVMTGLPGQTIEDIKETLQFVHDCGARSIVTRYALVPHTADFNREISKHPEYETEPLYHNNTLAPYRFSDSNDFWVFKELEQYCRELNQKL